MKLKSCKNCHYKIIIPFSIIEVFRVSFLFSAHSNHIKFNTKGIK